jgi:TRAP-type uncharacterized transport system fused permease subunit
MEFLASRWHCIVPVVVIVLVLMLGNKHGHDSDE